MGLVRVTQADKYFSLCVRERSGWVCEYCGKQYEKGTQGLHCSHLYSRRHKSVRHEPDNAFAHCFACHRALGADPVVYAQWARQILGDEKSDALARSHRSIVKHTKQRDKEIAAHYKAQWEEMMRKRYAGVTGRIEFEAYRG